MAKLFKLLLIILLISIFLFFSFEYYNEFQNYLIINYDNNSTKVNYIIDKNLVTLYLLLIKRFPSSVMIKNFDINNLLVKYAENFDDKNLITYEEQISDTLNGFIFFMNYINFRKEYFKKYQIINDNYEEYKFLYSKNKNIDKIDEYIKNKIKYENDISKLEKIVNNYKLFFNNTEPIYPTIIFYENAINLEYLLKNLYEKNSILIDKLCIEITQMLNNIFNHAFDEMNFNYFKSSFNIYIYVLFDVYFKNNNKMINFSAGFDKENKFITIPLNDNIEEFSILLLHEFIHYYYSSISLSLFNYAIYNFKEEILSNCLYENKLEYLLPDVVNPFIVNFIPIIRSIDIFNMGEYVKVSFENDEKFIEKFVYFIFNEFFTYTLTYYIYFNRYENTNKNLLIRLYFVDYISSIDWIKKRYFNLYLLQQYFLNPVHYEYFDKILKYGMNLDNILTIFKLFVYCHKNTIDEAINLLNK